MRLWAEEESRIDTALQRLEGALRLTPTAPAWRKSLILEEIASA